MKKGIFTVLVVAALLCALQPKSAVAVTSNEIREQIKELEAENAQLQEQMDSLESKMLETKGDIAQTVEQKNLLDQQIALLHGKISNYNDQIRTYGLLIADKQEELEKAQMRLSALNQKHKHRIREMEEQGKLSYWSVLFSARSLMDFLDRVDMIQEIAASDNRRLQELSDAAAQVESTKESLMQEKKALEYKRSELENSEEILEQKIKKSEQLLQDLLSDSESFKKLLAESEEKQNQLMEQIAQKENEYDKKAEEEWYATSVPPTTQTETQTTLPAVGEEAWLVPVPYYSLESPFGMRFHPLLNIWRMHNGIDMGCAMDTPIYATRSGIVTITDYQEAGAGIYVQINHGDGYRSIYMHMNRHVVSPGQSVAAGELIGYVGSTGLSSGPHLHFGISYNGSYVNPVAYLP